MDGPELSAVAVVAAALVVEAGVAVLRAGLDDLDAVDHELVEHVVGEAGRRLPAVHHARQAVLAVAAPARAPARLHRAGVSLLRAVFSRGFESSISIFRAHVQF